jgi:two-component system, OmpR family, sensor histidine kinase ChvG
MSANTEIEGTSAQFRRTPSAADAAAPGAAESRKGEAESGGREGRTKPVRSRRGWRSPLTRRILALNILVLVIPVVGLLHLEQYRHTLIASELDSLRLQARTFALTLGSTAVVGTPLGEERLLAEMARHLMRVTLADTGVRARVFARDGELVADSFVLVGPGGHVQVVELAPPEDSSVLSWLERLYERTINWLPTTGELPLYHESPVQSASDYAEVQEALYGETEEVVRAGRAGRLVLSVATPIQRYRQVLGALMLSKDGAYVDGAVRARRLDILVVFGVALAVTVLLSLYLAGTIARPIRRLAEAAEQVRHGKGRKFQIPDFGRRGDEIGDLSGALRDMTGALRARLDAIERFAADVAHEIKNPLSSLRSAVETVARVEDPDQQKKLMSIILDDVQRLDRLISDISDASRLDAELSRAQSAPIDIGRLLRALVDAQDATIGGGGPRFRLGLDDRHDLIVQGIEDRLGQVVRNLVTNALSFSPPDGLIDLAAWREGPWVVLTVGDEGPGIPENKLAAIFDRFYTERPSSEKFGTHSGLGLSISKQIVEAHGGSIVAENRKDSAGKITGARFTVRLPAD